MKIVQFLPTLAFGDAVGNDTVALQNAMRESGYQTEIFAEVVDQRLPKGTASPGTGAFYCIPRMACYIPGFGGPSIQRCRLRLVL